MLSYIHVGEPHDDNSEGMDTEDDGCIPDEGDASVNDADVNMNAADDDSYGNSLKELQDKAAIFILELKERYRLTQVATQGIIEGTTNLLQVSFLSMCMCYFPEANHSINYCREVTLS